MGALNRSCGPAAGPFVLMLIRSFAMKSQRWLLATLTTAAVGIGFVVGRSEKVAAAPGKAARRIDGRIGKYQIATYTTGEPGPLRIASWSTPRLASYGLGDRVAVSKFGRRFYPSFAHSPRRPGSKPAPSSPCRRVADTRAPAPRSTNDGCLAGRGIVELGEDLAELQTASRSPRASIAGRASWRFGRDRSG